jgi:acyl-CoA synthetase (AMP-forming)/AMP-acid ligase II/alkylation response protein AidB-like acyl-CoA dehydrogenase/acyl carrier protein
MSKHLCDPTAESSTLVELLRWRALQQPEQRAYHFLIDGKVEGPNLTYAELDCKARAIGALLQKHRARGERVMLLYPQGLEVIAAFCGCLYGGVIAIPVPPPEAGRLKRTLPRLQAIAKDAQASFVLTTSAILSLVEEFREQIPEFQAMRWIDTEQVALELAEEWLDPAVSRDMLAYLQYTSGSTSTPKGVMISHGNLMFHSAYLKKACGYTPDSITVTWMPYFHDYGLVEGLIQPLYNGTPCFVMSPFAFIKRPIHWLQAISRYKGTHSQAPNFAYDQCVRRISPEQRSTLDLSSWRAAGNAAEPINPKVIESFFTAFEPYGFRWNAFCPAYGLAEDTLLVSSSQQTDAPVLCKLDAAALEKNRIVDAFKYDNIVRTVVGCGRLVGDTKVAIVNPETLTQCEPDEVGEIWVSDPSVAQGYWNRPEETDRTFRAHLADTGEGTFLRTGDLGFLKDGELFITGRIKDLLIIRGTNHYPQDIEWTVQRSHPVLRSEHGAAFSVDVDGEERLVVAQEVERHHRNLDVNEVVEAIRQAVAENHELEVYAVLLLKTGSILKTSSGKVQRQASRAGFLDGSLNVVGTWTANKVAKLEQETVPMPPVPNIRINGATDALTEPRYLQTDLSVKATDVTAAQDISRERADAIIGWLRTYANERINSRLIDERRCIPPYVVLDFGNRGILGMQIPEQYGGTALGNRDAMRVVEQLAAIDLTLATFVVNNDFLGIRPIQRYGTKALRDELLPILAKGRELAAFALTEPGAGSNPQTISATGVADAIGGWRLRGTKVWSGSASWAGVINVFVKLVDANGNSSGITGFAVRQGTAGLRPGPESLTMGMRGMVQNFIHLDDVPVGSVNLLGEPGAGMEAGQDAMLYTRLAIGAMSVGGMKRCAQLMHRYATRRSIGTGRLLDNPVTLARLSDLTAATTAFETLVARICELLDDGWKVPAEAYVACKTAGPELLWKAADSFVQLLGGRGYIETNIASQILRDARVFRIFEGPTETLNMFLGSRVLHQSDELHEFLCNGLGAIAVSDSLRDAAEQIQARWSESTAPFSDRPSALRWASMLIGEVATSAIMLAAVQGIVNLTPSSRLRRAVDWAQQQFDQTLARAVSGTSVESMLLNANETTDLISSYGETIGDLEQTLAGEDDALDGLLRRNPSAASLSQMTNLPGAMTAEVQSLKPDARNSSYTAESIGDLEQTLAGKDDALDRLLRRDLSAASPSQMTNLPEAVTPEVKYPKIDSSISNHTAESIETWLAKWIADELEIEIDSIDTRKSFVQYGLDSVTAIRLIDDLEVWLRRQISPSLAWEYPSIEAVAQHLVNLS